MVLEAFLRQLDVISLGCVWDVDWELCQYHHDRGLVLLNPRLLFADKETHLV